jgi:SAM-dependent methyltransferase
MSDINQKKLEGLVKQTGGMVAAGFNCAISVLGDRLDLYKGLWEHGPCTSNELAAALSLHERWVREWLYHQTCIGQVEFDESASIFSLSPEAHAVLVDKDHPAFFMGGYDSALAVFPAVEKLEESFRSGIGMSYDDHGPNCACGIERMGAFTNEYRLVPELLPLVPGMTERLAQGGIVADVGCGGAISTIAMAQAFPNAQFIGYDTSDNALDRARANVAEARVTNLRLVNPLIEAMPSTSTFDLVTTFDVVHDTPYPDRLIADIYTGLKRDGYWLCEDIRGFESFQENLRDHPIAGLLYGFSVMVCMNSGMSTPDGAGLGTLGFTRDLARQMTAAAGFTHFSQLEFENTMNNYYLLSK